MRGMTVDYEGLLVSADLESNFRLFEALFKNDAIFRKRTIEIKNTHVKCMLFYLDGMVNSQILNDSIVRPLLTGTPPDSNNMFDFICEKILYASDIKKQTEISECIRSLLYGDTLLFVDGSETALSINTKGFKTRGISEPSDERVLQGPREGFGETAMFNLSMIRRKLLTPDLCIEMMRVGKRTETMVFICYLGSLADKKQVSEIKRRIGKINIDGILDTNYIAENIRDHKSSLLKTTGTTERPDIVAARLLEGRIAVVVDGTPIVMTIPYLFSENFQSDEDYYVNYFVATIGRVLRYVCFFAAISVPAVFVALITFHKQLLPTSFALSIAQLRGGVPLSSFAECVTLILVFEILKETGLRMPQSLGHALSIVGGLVVGQAAVQARIVSAPMLIAVALSGISGLMVPRLRGVVFYMRLALTFASALFGLFGYIALMSILLVRILTLTSLGVDYTVSLSNPKFERFKDTVLRVPWTMMKTRPAFNHNKIRIKDNLHED